MKEILTKDSVTVAVDAVIYYKVAQPMSAICNIADYANRCRFD
jgi:erythrocyte band 7 integral membrane protein